MSSTLFFQHFMVLTFIGILNPLWQFYKSNLNWIQNTWFLTSRCYIAVVVPHITFYIALSVNLSSTPSLIIILLLFLKKNSFRKLIQFITCHLFTSKTDICICSLWVVWMLGAVKITLVSVSIPGTPYLCISVILLICLKLHNLKTVLIYFLWFSLSWWFITNYQI